MKNPSLSVEASTSTTQSNPNGFIKFNRVPEFWELIENPKHHKSFILLTVIAQRARRTSAFNVNNLKVGEALIGDFEKYGMTEQEYRTAKAKLEKWEFATFKGTGKGTIATLCNSAIYDINSEASNGQNNELTTDKQRTSNGQATTNKNVKNDKNVKNEINIPFEDFWTAYNKKEGSKADTEKKWQKLTNEERTAIMNGVFKYANGFTSDRKQFQPYASTFLNQRRWENEEFTGKNRQISLAPEPIPGLGQQDIAAYGRFENGLWMLGEKAISLEDWFKYGKPTKDDWNKAGQLSPEEYLKFLKSKNQQDVTAYDTFKRTVWAGGEDALSLQGWTNAGKPTGEEYLKRIAS